MSSRTAALLLLALAALLWLLLRRRNVYYVPGRGWVKAASDREAAYWRGVYDTKAGET